MLVERLLQMVARAILLFAVSCAYADQYTLTDLGTLGGDVSVGEAINNNAQVAGITNTANGTATAFLYTGGKMTDLGIVSGGTFSEGTSINSAGVVAGNSGIPGVSIHAVIFSNSQITDLGTLGGLNSTGIGINASGQVAGYSEIVGNPPYRHAFLYKRGNGLQDIGTLGGPESIAQGINDSGAVVGYSGSALIAPPHAFLYSNGKMIDLGTLPPVGNVIPLSVATAINASGQVAGYSSADDRGDRHAFLFSQGAGMLDLGTLGGSESFGFAINSGGQIVGKSDTTSGSQHGFLYTPGGSTSLVDLNTLVAGSPLASSVTLVESHGINDDGLIVADGVNARNGQTHAYLLTPISALLASLKAEAAGVGPGTSLVDQVTLAETFHEANDIGATCAELTGFSQLVKAQTGKKIQPNVAAKLISDDATIQAALNCPY